MTIHLRRAKVVTAREGGGSTVCASWKRWDKNTVQARATLCLSSDSTAFTIPGKNNPPFCVNVY